MTQVQRFVTACLFFSLLAAIGYGQSPAASLPTAVEPQTVLFLGDSLTAGYGLAVDDAYPAVIQQKIETARLPWKAINAGLSGETTAGGLRRLNWLLKRPIDILVIALGGNDALRGIPLDETRRNLEQIILRTQGKYPQARLVLAGMQAPPNLGTDYTTGFAALYPELAQKHGIPLVPFLLEGVGGIASLNQNDGIHPTPEGQKILAENVWRILEPLLRGDEKPSRSNVVN